MRAWRARIRPVRVAPWPAAWGRGGGAGGGRLGRAALRRRGGSRCGARGRRWWTCTLASATSPCPSWCSTRARARTHWPVCVCVARSAPGVGSFGPQATLQTRGAQRRLRASPPDIGSPLSHLPTCLSLPPSLPLSLSPPPPPPLDAPGAAPVLTFPTSPVPPRPLFPRDETPPALLFRRRRGRLILMKRGTRRGGDRCVVNSRRLRGRGPQPRQLLITVLARLCQRDSG